MKSSYILLAILFLTLGAFSYSNDDHEPTVELVPLSGTYTIGINAPDYATITDAIADLTDMGISGPVTFEIDSGSYIEQLLIGEITGSSATNTIKFRSADQDSSKVVISFTSPSNPNYVFQITQTDYLTFEDLSFESGSSYGRIFTLVDTVENLTFQNCVFRSSDINDYHIYGNNIETFNLTVKNCLFENNGYGIYLDGTSNGGNYIDGLLIENNFFNGVTYRPIYTNLFRSPVIKNNEIHSETANTTSKIYITNGYDSIVVSDNIIDVPSASPAISVISYRTPTGTGNSYVRDNVITINSGTGLQLQGSGNAFGVLEVYGNIVNVIDGNYGVQYYYDGTPNNRAKFFNNFFNVGGSATNYGFYGSGQWYVDIYHNSFNISQGNGSSYAYWESCGRFNEMVNNIFHINGNGYPLYVGNCYTDVFNLIDHNAYYSDNGTFFYRLAEYPDFETYQSVWNLDSNSLFAPAYFLNDTSYQIAQIAFDSAGLALADVTIDIEGQSRNIAGPDIGADEFEPPLVDAGVASVFGPPAPFGAGLQPVTAIISNSGVNTLTAIDISWEVNGQLQTIVNWSGALSIGDTAHVLLGTYDFQIDTGHQLKSWTSNPNGGSDAFSINDTSILNNVYAGLSGTYTLGGATPDISDFNKLQNHLNFGGVYGPVQIDVRSGTYTEQINLFEFPGSDPSRIVTIQSESGDSTTVTLNYNSPSTANYVVTLDQADNISFSKMTFQSLSNSYGRIFTLVDTVENFTVENCVFTATDNNDYHIYGNDIENFNTTIKDSRFTGNGYAIHLDGTSNNATYIPGLIIDNNIFENQLQRAIYSRYHNSPIITDNLSTSQAFSSTTKIQIQNSYDSTRIEGNIVNWPNGGSGYYLDGYRTASGTGDMIIRGNEARLASSYGFYIGGSGNVNGSIRFTGNIADLTAGQYGVQYYYSANTNNRGLFANNYFHVGGGNTKYGIYGSSHWNNDIYHNSINITSTGGTGYGYWESCGRYNELVNNAITVQGSGYSVYVGSCYNEIFNRSDNNAFFSPSGVMVYKGIEYPDLASYQSVTALDSNSIYSNAFFIDNSSFQVGQVALHDAGVLLDSITVDIEGEQRDSMPDIGADEFILPSIDAGIMTVLPPQASFPVGQHLIKATLKNFGSDALLSATIAWEINDVPQVSVNWTGTLVSGDTILVDLDTLDFVLGQGYKIEARTNNPNSITDPIAVNDSAFVDNVYAGLSGTYTLGGVTPDFPDFLTAQNHLNYGGVYGPVFIDVRDSTYIEQINFNSFPGSDVTNTVTFRAENGDSSLVILSYDAINSSGYTMRLDGTDNITFEKMTFQSVDPNYGNVVVLLDTVENITFENCAFLSVEEFDYHIYGNNIENFNTTIRNCFFQGNGYGIHLDGTPNDNNYITGTLIENNVFEGLYYRGIYTRYQRDARILNNEVNVIVNSNNYKIEITDCYDGCEISGNTVSAPLAGYGMYVRGYRTADGTGDLLVQNNSINVQHSAGVTIEGSGSVNGKLIFTGNNINVVNGNYGLQYYYDGVVNNRALVANNMIHLGGSSTKYGFYGSSHWYTDIYHNTFSLTPSGGTSYGYYGSCGRYNQMNNNIFNVEGNGFALYVSNCYSNPFNSLDYNDYRNLSGNLIHYRGSNYVDLPSYVAAWNIDSNSVNVEPLFVNDTFDLHVTNVLLDKLGTPVSEVTIDIDGDTRDPIRPDIGADEFTTAQNDLAIISLDAPVMLFPAGNQQVSISVLNNGLDTLDSFTIQWEINGEAQLPFDWTGEVFSGGSIDSLVIGNSPFEIDSNYTLKFWTENPNGQPDGFPLDDTLLVTNVYVALGGEYTLGGVSPDFESFQHALTSLENGGVIDSVIFNVRDGNYTERLVINEINGASNERTICFQSESADPTLVNLNFAGSVLDSTFVIVLDGADHFRFKELTIESTGSIRSRVVELKNGANWNSFIGNSIIGNVVSSTSAEHSLISHLNNQINEHNVFKNNSLIGGSSGIYYISSSSYSDGVKIIGNTFQNQYYRAVFSTYLRNLQISGNTIFTNSGYGSFYALQPNNSGRSLRIDGNTINVNSGGRGIQFSSYNDEGTFEYAVVANNFIICNGTATSIGIASSSSDYIKYLYNTIRINNTHSGSHAINVGSGSDHYLYNNIIANFGAGQTIVTSNASYLTDSDFNNLYTDGTVFATYGSGIDDLADWQSATGYDANSFSLDPLFENDSSFILIEIEFNDAGTPVDEVTTDIEGEPRDADAPDMGVDEYTPIIPDDIGIVEILSPNMSTPFSGVNEEVEVALRNNGSNIINSAMINWSVDGINQVAYSWSGTLQPGDRDTVMIGTTNLSFNAAHDMISYSSLPNGVPDNTPKNDTTKALNLYAGLIGIYTIGGILPDFNSIDEAVTILNNGGVLGAVELRLRNGTYNEQLKINEVAGVSDINTVKFTSESGDPGLVTLQFNGTSSNPYVIRLNDSDHFIFENLTLQSFNNSYGSVVYIQNEAESNSFINNFIVANSNTYDDLIYSPATDNDNNNQFIGNTFLKGGRALDLRGVNGTRQAGIVIEENQFIDQHYESIYLDDHLGPIISNNTFSFVERNPNNTSIHLYDCDGMAVVENNVIKRIVGSGISMEYCNGLNSLEKARVVNNVISLGGTSAANGLYLNQCSLVDVIHNSVHLYNTNTTSKSFFGYYNSNGTARNNIFSNSGGGYAYYIQGTPANVSDYNDIYATGVNLGYWLNTNIPDLNTWQSTSGKDLNSISINPLFYSDQNLHILQVALDSAAQLIPSINEDFEGDPRNATHRDIGADEFDFITDDLGIIAVLNPVDTCELSASEQIMVVIQNYGGLVQTGFDIEVIVNSETSITENVGGIVVPPGDTVHYQMTNPADLSDYQVHSLIVKTNLVGDLNPDNDILLHIVQNYQLPDAPTNLLPADGQMDISKPTTLSWLPAAGATLYDLYIWADTLPQPATPFYSDLTQISAVINSPVFEFGITYAWQIVAKNPFCSTPSLIQTFTLRELPDLIASNIQVPNNPFSSQMISVSWNVDNVGIGATLDETWYDQIYLSVDNSLNKSIDQYLGAIANLSALAPNESYAHSLEVTLPQGISGTWYVFVIPNGYSGIPESDLTNNPLAAPINISLTPPPDLQVTSVIPPNNIFSGQEVTMSYTVTNEGAGDTEESNWKDYIYISDSEQFNLNTATYLKSITHTLPLLAGQSYTNGTLIEIPDEIFGDYFIHVFTDRLSQVYEFAFEDNNIGTSDTINIILTPPPDLELTSIMLPDTLYPSQVVNFLYTVTNVGANPAIGNWKDRIYISQVDTFDASLVVLKTITQSTALGQGSQYIRNAQITVPSMYDGEYFLHFRTDYTNQVFEFNSEANNYYSSGVIPVVPPDLQIDNITATDTGYSGKPVLVLWENRNSNRGKVLNKTVKDAVYFSSVDSFDVSAIEIGELSYSVTLNQESSVLKQMTVNLPNGLAGQYYLHVKSDHTNVVFEGTNENNNASSIPITMQLSPSPDLQVMSFAPLPDTTFTVVNTVPVSFTVGNLGAGDATGSAWTDFLYLSIDTVWNPASPNNYLLEERERFLALDQNNNYSLDFDIVFPMVEELVPGLDSFTFYLYAFTDHEDDIYEHLLLNDNNVLRSDPIFLVCPTEVDLVVSDLTTVPDTLQTSQDLTLSWTIQNLGTSTEIWEYDFWYNGIYLSNDTIWDENDLLIQDFTKEGPLDSLEYYTNQKTIKIPEVPSGIYCLMLVADNKNYLDEESKSNNVGIFPVIGPPTNIYIKQKPPSNLVAKSFTAPVDGTSGQPIEIIYKVKNEGVGAVDQDWVDKIYLSTDFTISNSDNIIYTKVKNPDLLPGEEYLDTIQAFLPINKEGNFILLFKTDANNKIFEMGEEADNSLFTFIAIDRDDPSDLIVNDLTVPASVFVNQKIDVDYTVKNIGQFPASGFQRDILYLSQDSIFDVGDIQLDIKELNANVAPGATQDRMIEMVCTPGVPLGDYHVIVQTDALNNIYEVSDENNVFISPDKITILVEELPMDVMTPNDLGQKKSVFYRIEIPDTLHDETMLVSLTTNTLDASNEMYLSWEEMPTRSTHDFSHKIPFSGNQEVVVPELDSGTYYLHIYGQYQENFTQNINVKAEIVPFYIQAIEKNIGGNTGTMTARITGAKFTENMTVMLTDTTLGAHQAHKLYFINSTEVYASFNLAGADTGVYDLVIVKPGNISTDLSDAFTIVSGPVGTIDGSSVDNNGFTCTIKNLGTENLLSKNIITPNAVRVGRVVPITIQFGNNGTMDIPCPQRFILSVRGAPLGFTAEELPEMKQELLLVFEEPGGPPGILRPGATGSITVYTFSSHPLRFYIQE